MLTYAVLRDIQRREMESSALVELDADFFSKVGELLAEKKNEARQGKSMLPVREYENIKKIVRDIQIKREEKMVLMAIRGDKSGKGLTPDELELLEELISTVEKGRSKLVGIWSDEGDDPVRVKVLMVRDVEKYKGLDNKTYGPFKEGEEHLLPEAEAKWLSKEGMAKPG
jgi:hypothetical protein